MSPPRELPSPEDLIDFQGAVAGHAGTLRDPNGELFVKPCTQAEIDFYQLANAEHPELADLMPVFYGKLELTSISNAKADVAAMMPTLQDGAQIHVQQLVTNLETPASTNDNNGSAATAAPPDSKDTWVPRGGQSINSDRGVVLENTTCNYQKPNVLDVKLGQRLYADDAPPQKRQRMQEMSASTTHGELGFRISGMRVFRGSDTPAELDESEYKTYDKDFGRYHVNKENVTDAFRKFIFNNAAQIDADLGRAIAEVFKKELERFYGVLAAERTRMFSSSLLFVFEGDGPALRAAIAAHKEAAPALEVAETVIAEATTERARSRCTPSDDDEDGTTGSIKLFSARSSSRTDSGVSLNEEEEAGAKHSNPFSADGAYDDGSDVYDNDDDMELELPGVCSLRLIDFAHAEFLPEGGNPDENVLVGIRSLIDIFDELSQ